MHTSYLMKVLDNENLAKAIKVAVRKLKRIQFDAIAVIGNSGTLFGGALALKLKKPIFLVRKRGDGSHALTETPAFKVEGPIDRKSYVFVDDMVCSGTTRSFVVEMMTKHFPEVRQVGTYQYRGEVWSPVEQYMPPPDFHD